MPSNKDRLYVGLYARGGTAKMPGGEDRSGSESIPAMSRLTDSTRYHWALLVAPKVEDSETRGKRFHAKERIYSGMQSVWEFSEQETGTSSTLMILVRIQVAKVMNMRSLEAILRSVPVRGEQRGWNCVEWVREALAALQNDNKALGTSVLDWATVRDTAMWYVEQKAMQHRFDGQAAPGQFDTSRVSTYDLLERKELVP
ncbi:hypothetical protein BFJ63_vAg18137 [Fusarium oxysporum f. sp. narcissi]|uniref:Uncharacterized protein n=2 Tax=Fusarium oxysporum TaxID=5507 RepID=A0A4Q2V2V0_FUSOX|nr:hypothetical protein FOVG_17811 [Fusarium oxysporum f. sp. pisi HDV247]RYC78988.1 hypothetical protein BFJ63_vAg18137 [Fusarium oxysporum f. sp. narcissi]